MKISEIFYSIQGEGSTAGRPRLFIRTSGCTLKCSFCDTKYHIKGRELNKKDLALLKKYPEWVFTGGEPLIWKNEIKELLAEYNPLWVEFETNGTIEADRYLADNCFFNISPKEKRFQPKGYNPDLKIFNTIPPGADNYIAKFVYSDSKSERFILNTIRKYQISPYQVWIMPEGISPKQLKFRRKKVWAFCLKHKFNYSDRFQVELFGKKKGI